MARKILLADDSVTAQNMGRKILADAGYEVITVNNGSAALKKISEQKPDLIVLDVYMPGYSGLEVCQRLKEAQDTARIPVLLTVGKLEPFKPEEAKRVRAEGYIVKPFEASELLSALTKLEDKIVPRSEPKQGRFARAIAAVEDTSAPENVEEDSSWKSRISFPKKKKKKAEEDEDENGEDAAIAASSKELKSVEAVALPAGLPRDVTPEEIAAIAAAAAHVQAVVDSAKESPAETETKSAEPPSVASQVVEPVAQAPIAEVKEAKSEEKIESKTEAVAKSEVPEIPVAAPAEAVASEAVASTDTADVPATFASASLEEKSEVTAAPEPVLQKEMPPEPPSHADVIAAIAALEPANGSSWSNETKTAAPESAVAVAGSAANRTDGIRWTAVPAQLDPAEAAISLEAEMQKAYAAFAAAEANQPGFVASTPEPEPTRPQDSMSVQAAVVEAASQYPNSEPELAQAVSAVAGVTTEAVAAAAAELAAVAASLAKSKASEETETQAAAPVPPEPVVEAAAQQTPAQPVAEVQPAVEEPAPAVAETPAQAEPVMEAPQVVAAKEEEPAPVQEAQPVQEEKIAEPPVAVEEPVVAKAEEVPQASAPEPVSEAQPVAPVADVAAHPPAKSDVAAHTDGLHNESDIHATTAAAWASWRQIRESDGKSQPSDAAMAVAAGAEKSPTEAASESGDPAIANLVESVLADLRPKIVAEISKKLGEKK